MPTEPAIPNTTHRGAAPSLPADYDFLKVALEQSIALTLEWLAYAEYPFGSVDWLDYPNEKMTVWFVTDSYQRSYGQRYGEEITSESRFGFNQEGELVVRYTSLSGNTVMRKVLYSQTNRLAYSQLSDEQKADLLQGMERLRIGVARLTH